MGVVAGEGLSVTCESNVSKKTVIVIFMLFNFVMYCNQPLIVAFFC